jgi:RNA polymerase sigma-70 factor, ECF subfamily
MLRNQVFGLVCQHMRTLTGGHGPDFEDLVQSAAERALRDLPAFEGRSSLSTWVFRLCYSVLLTQRRWYRRWLRRFTLTTHGELPEPLDPRIETPSVEWRERHQRVRQAVDRLSPKRRVVVLLHDLQGMGVDEIAENLGISPLTVRSRLRDGRKDLASRLSKDPYFGDEACRARKESS